MLTHRTQAANILKETLVTRGVTKQDLADHLGVTPSSISKWLRRDRPEAVPPIHWERLCAYLEIPWKVWIEAVRQDRPEDVCRYRRLVRSLSGQFTASGQ